MKRLTTLLCFLVILSCFGQVTPFQRLQFYKGKPKAASGTAPNVFAQDFETGTLPAGWAVDSGTPAWNSTPALLGTYSLQTPSACGVYCSSAKTEVYVFAYYQPASLSTLSQIFHVFNSAGGSYPANEMLRISLNTTGTLKVECKAGGSSATTVSTMTAGQTYYVWIHFKFVTATTSVASVAFSQTMTEPTSGNNFASVSNGTANYGAADYEFGPGGLSSVSMKWDHVGISTAAMSAGW